MYSYSVDGFGDRDDIVLAREKSQGTIRENQRNEEAQRHARIADAQKYSEDGEPITRIVKRMIERESYGALLLKQDIRWDVETLSEAVTEACIQLGLSDEDFSPSLVDQGHEVEIRLV